MTKQQTLKQMRDARKLLGLLTPTQLTNLRGNAPVTDAASAKEKYPELATLAAGREQYVEMGQKLDAMDADKRARVLALLPQESEAGQRAVTDLAGLSPMPGPYDREKANRLYRVRAATN